MKQETNKFTYELIYFLILFVLLIVNTLYGSEYESLFTLGEVSTSITFAGMFVYLIKSWMDRTTYDVSLNKIYLSFILFIIVFSISFFTSEYMDGLEFIN